MKTSESIAAIAPALLAAQKTVANVAKSATNPHFKSKYVPLDELLPACKAALNEQGVVFIQGTEPSESGEVLHLTTRLLHSSGEWIESTLTMKPVKADPQGIGSCITYARRYALAAICGVASEEDDDANAASTEPAKSKPATVPAGGFDTRANVHDETKSLMGRIAVQKKRPAAAMLTEEDWVWLLKQAFDVDSKEAIKGLTPMELKNGIDKLAILIDEMETK